MNRSMWLCAAGAAVCLGFAAGAPDQPSGETSRGLGSGFKPVPLPDPKIPGFVFPEKEATILDWVAKDNQKAIHLHGWGLWTALTSPSGEKFNGQELLVSETWLTDQDLLSASVTKVKTLAQVTRDRLHAHPLRQFSIPRKGGVLPPTEGDETVTGFVKYDPSAAQFILDQKLFSKSTLTGLLQAGKADVPNFPSTAMSLKSVFQTLDKGSLKLGRYFMIPVWPGPPADPVAFPPSAWKQCVWIDVMDPGPGKGTGKVDTVCKADGSSRTDETTYGVGRFVHFKLTASQARSLNAIHAARRAPVPGKTPFAVAGDYSVLLAMHVTSREITRWTWQTFWWAPNPDNPPAPSSKAIAQARPKQLHGAPRHYAMAIAYSMTNPDQPNTGGKNVGNSVYAYNPYLEAGFGPKVLIASKPGTYNGKPVPNNVGVQTNCMSCHNQACYSPTTPFLESQLYTGDQYIDMKGPQFQNRLRTDFLWSIPDNAR